MKNVTCNFKKAILLTALTGLLTAAIAQEQRTSTETTMQPKIGIRGGINLSNLYVDDVEDENMKVGLNLGVFAKFPLTRGLSLQPEIAYSSKGSKVRYNNAALGEGEYRFNLNYVEMPRLAVVNVGKNFNIHAGPYAALLTSANIKRMDEDLDVDHIADLNTDDFKRWDFGLIGGLGFDIQNFTIGARYNYGLNEVGDGGVSGEALKNSKNSAFTFYIGIGF